MAEALAAVLDEAERERRPALAGSTACCELHEGAMDHLNGFIITANARAGRGDLYKNPPFRFCPWCGRETP